MEQKDSQLATWSAIDDMRISETVALWESVEDALLKPYKDESKQINHIISMGKAAQRVKTLNEICQELA